VNGKRIHKCVLKDGDEISFGPYKLMFQKDADEYIHDPVLDMPNATNTATDTIVSVENTLISGPVAANK